MNSIVNTSWTLPAETLRRSALVQEAALAYIYRGQLNLSALAKKAGVSYGALVRAAKEDGWVAWRKRYMENQMASDAALLERSPAEMEAIYEELDRRPDLVTTLVDEREECLTRMSVMPDKSTKAYAVLVGTFSRLCAEIERLTGVRDFLAELSRHRVGLGKPKASEEPEAGVVLGDDVLLE